MPIYDYECKACGHVFDEKRKIDERDNPIDCPKCGGKEAKRQMGGFSLPKYRGKHFKSQVEPGAKPHKTYYPSSKQPKTRSLVQP